WNHLTAAGALPIRRVGGFRPVEIPADMRPMSGCLLNDLDSTLLFSRLTQYAKRLGLIAPTAYNETWIGHETYSRNLLVDQENIPRPTLAGWLLFARAPE